MRTASALVLLLFVALLPVSSGNNSPPVEVELFVEKYDWLSNETIELSVEMSNAQFN